MLGIGKVLLSLIFIGGTGGDAHQWETQDPLNKEITQEESTITNGWETYTNPELGFQIKHPPELIDMENENLFCIGFTYGSDRCVWIVTIYQPDELEKAIANHGSQFVDKEMGYNARQEFREQITTEKNLSGTMVTVTTPDWVAQLLYFEHNGKLFELNGGFDQYTFETFYNNFEFIE